MKDKKVRKLLFGVGVNDADYVVRPKTNGKETVCPFHSVWKNMLMRCYCDKYQLRQPTYAGCSVCEEWLVFSNFKKWMEGQNFEGNQLDKDLLIQGNTIYKHESCVFVPHSLNSLLLDNGATRGDLPIGVYWFKRDDKSISQIKVDGETKYLGIFKRPEEAHRAWQQAKKDLIYKVAVDQTNIKIKEALLLRCTQLQHDLDNNLETIKL